MPVQGFSVKILILFDILDLLAYYFKYLLINQVITFLIMRYDRHCTRH